MRVRETVGATAQHELTVRAAAGKRGFNIFKCDFAAPEAHRAAQLLAGQRRVKRCALGAELDMAAKIAKPALDERLRPAIWRHRHARTSAFRPPPR